MESISSRAGDSEVGASDDIPQARERPRFAALFGLIGRQFEDLASSDVATAPGPVRVIGVPHISWFILNLNLP